MYSPTTFQRFFPFLRAKVPLGCNARKFVELFSGIEQLDEVKRRTVESLKTLQTADPKKKRLIEPQVFREWVLPKMPDADPCGRLLTKATQTEIAEHCHANRKEFYKSCPAMAVEDALGEIRTRDANRKPEEPDTLDLQHSVVALAYCNIFVTADGYVYQCATQAAKMLPILGSVGIYRNLDAIIL
jgi:hypothetical protein